MRRFLLRRLLGLVMVMQGLITLFTPFRPGLNMWVARKIARENGRRMIRSVPLTGPGAVMVNLERPLPPIDVSKLPFPAERDEFDRYGNPL